MNLKERFFRFPGLKFDYLLVNARRRAAGGGNFDGASRDFFWQCAGQALWGSRVQRVYGQSSRQEVGQAQGGAGSQAAAVPHEDSR